MKQCRECGTLSPDDTVFCYICGARFRATDEKSENAIEVGSSVDKGLGEVLLNEEEAESIVRYIVGCFYRQENFDLSSDTFAMNRIRQEIAKNSATLKRGATVGLSFPYLTADVTGPKHLDIDVSLDIAADSASDYRGNGNMSALRMNGVYYFIEGGFRYLLKFYPDGVVQGTSDAKSTIPSAVEIRNITYRDQGNYSIVDQQLSFNLGNQQGQVDYWGQISGDTLILNLHSHINGHRASNEVYQFIEM